jgi:hypothetical protein
LAESSKTPQEWRVFFTMNTSFKSIALITIAVLVGVLLVALLAGTALAQGPWGSQGGFGWSGHGMTRAPARSAGVGGWSGSGSGMMGGYGYGLAPTTGITGTTPYGPGACPGMGGWGYASPVDGNRLTLDQAGEAVEQYLAANGNPDLAVAEVMEFTQNFYAEVEEQSTGIHAFELLIDPYTGAVYPEPGPNMMWNTKYGHMGGMGGYMGGMGGYGFRQPTADMPVSAQQAREYAQTYLDSYLPGTTIADEADPFYGYYTLHTLQDGQVTGMLSVNGFNGQVWYHSWHGDFIAMTGGHQE